mmetsp:Transcript_8597/g.10610  ORF Transcript_8597/g.10610 Transcript_8597/m.10610 type:complete len:125 (-) Transcript_8597:364-738(-)
MHLLHRDKVESVFYDYLTAHADSKFAGSAEVEAKEREMFEMIDKNHDGELDKKEIDKKLWKGYSKAVSRVMTENALVRGLPKPKEPNKQEFEALVTRLDVDKSGTFNFKEFQSLVRGVAAGQFE